MPEASPHLDAQRVLGGRYRLVRSIASGGMAEVWEAHDQVLGRRVAVKVMHRHLADDASFRARFRREAIAAARLAHPNVVATYDTGLDDGVAYIVMELVEGRTLAQVLAEQGALEPARATHIAIQVADAVDYAHQAGVIHRDVKPANILLGEDDRVKVADFGIAKATIEALEDASGPDPTDLTQSGSLIGTPKYLSPEQVNGQPVDGRADVYAAGVVLYEMLTGRPPFLGDTDVAVAVQHATAIPPSPRRLRPGIPAALETVVLRAMAKDPAARFATAGELHAALLGVDHQPDDAVPSVVADPTPPEGQPAMVRARRSWVVPIVVVTVLAVTLGVVGLLFARSDTGHTLLDPPSAGAPQPVAVPIARALSFDPPPGDGREHDAEASHLLDGNPSTTWSTEQYASPQFGGIKAGVGFILELGASEKLGELQVDTKSRGWAAEVLVADAAHPDQPPSQWAQSAATKSGIDGSGTFDLGGRTGRVVVVWITNMGDGNTMSVSDVHLTSAA